MGSIISAIRDDIAEYERLCAEYGEAIVMDYDGTPDCYGPHAKELQNRHRELQLMLRSAAGGKE